MSENRTMFIYYTPFPATKAYLAKLAAKNGLTPGRVANPRGIQAMCEMGKPPVWETFRDDVAEVLQLKKPLPKILFKQLGGELDNLTAAFEADEVLHQNMLAISEPTTWGVILDTKFGEEKPWLDIKLTQERLVIKWLKLYLKKTDQTRAFVNYGEVKRLHVAIRSSGSRWTTRLALGEDSTHFRISLVPNRTVPGR